MIKYISTQKSRTLFLLWLYNVYMHVCTQAIAACINIYLFNEQVQYLWNMSFVLSFLQQFTRHEFDCTIFLYLLDQGSRLLKLISYTSRDNKASFEKKIVGNYSKCKVIKAPSQFSTCWTYTKERETIKKCKLQTQILFQMKNWTRWKIALVKYCIDIWLTFFDYLYLSGLMTSTFSVRVWASDIFFLGTRLPWWIRYLETYSFDEAILSETDETQTEM